MLNSNIFFLGKATEFLIFNTLPLAVENMGLALLTLIKVLLFKKFISKILFFLMEIKKASRADFLFVGN